eukprot:3345448-Pyramimonas_sp.AAC.1
MLSGVKAAFCGGSGPPSIHWLTCALISSSPYSTAPHDPQRIVRVNNKRSDIRARALRRAHATDSAELYPPTGCCTAELSQEAGRSVKQHARTHARTRMHLHLHLHTIAHRNPTRPIRDTQKKATFREFNGFLSGKLA